MEKIRKTRQAAAILSGFNYTGINDYCFVDLYYRDKDGDLFCESLEAFSSSGEWFFWDKKQWLAWIADSCKCDHIPAKLVAIRISIKKDDDRFRNQQCSVEITDLDQCSGFDRLVVYKNGTFLEADLTRKESQRIHSAYDVLHLADKLSFSRFSKTENNLPRVWNVEVRTRIKECPNRVLSRPNAIQPERVLIDYLPDSFETLARLLKDE